jgi:hypothetical protein
MTTMSNVPNLPWNMMSVGSGHRNFQLFLIAAILTRKNCVLRLYKTIILSIFPEITIGYFGPNQNFRGRV